MKLFSMALALVVSLVPCYGQSKATAPATKVQAKQTVSAERRFALKAYDDAVLEQVAMNTANNTLWLETKAEEAVLSVECFERLKQVDIELAPVHITQPHEQEETCRSIVLTSARKKLEEINMRIADGRVKVATLEVLLERTDQCARVYRTTINKRVSDVTVSEDEQIKACRLLNLYPPEK